MYKFKKRGRRTGGYKHGSLYVKRVLQRKKMVKEFTLEDFPKWEPIVEWDRSVILWGESGIGKTEFAKAHFENALIITRVGDLKELCEEHDGIIFDDMCFTHTHRCHQTHLVENEHESDIHIPYTTAHIPAGTKKIFTTNVENGFCVDLLEETIADRCKVVHLIGNKKRKI